MTIDEVEKIKMVIENKNDIAELVNTVAKEMIEAFKNIKIEDVNMFQLGYNKAIDDFAEKIKSNDRLGYVGCLDKIIDEMAEQLKEGVSK